MRDVRENGRGNEKRIFGIILRRRICTGADGAGWNDSVEAGDYCRAEEQIYRNSYPSRHALESHAGENLRDYKHGEERRREQNGRLEGRCDRDYRAETRSLNEHGVMNERAAEQRVGE